MKVKDLLKELKKLDPETEIFHIKNDMEKGEVVEPVRIIEISGFKCESKTENFTDAFDYTRYESTVERLSSSGAIERFMIKIY